MKTEQSEEGTQARRLTRDDVARLQAELVDEQTPAERKAAIRKTLTDIRTCVRSRLDRRSSNGS